MPNTVTFPLLDAWNCNNHRAFWPRGQAELTALSSGSPDDQHEAQHWRWLAAEARIDANAKRGLAEKATMLSIAEQRARRRLLIDGASFGPEALKVIGEVFDAAWAEIAGTFADAPVEANAARTKLATPLLAVSQKMPTMLKLSSEPHWREWPFTIATIEALYIPPQRTDQCPLLLRFLGTAPLVDIEEAAGLASARADSPLRRSPRWPIAF